MKVESGARVLEKSTRALLLAVALAGAGGPAGAQEPEPEPRRGHARVLVFREQLAPFAESVRRMLGPGHERFRATLDALAAQEARQHGLAGEVDFSFSANEIGDFSGASPGNETLFGLRTGARLSGGGYRSRIRLLADMRALVHDNVFEQDFSRLRLGYDYRRTGHAGAFAFIERYSDDAMSIASRYEIGAGASFGVDLWPRADGAGARALAHLESAGADGFRCGVERLRAGFHPAGGAAPPACASAAPAGDPAHRPAAGRPRPALAVFDRLLDVAPDLQRALAARQAGVSLSLGVGVFSEFENALIETRVSRIESPGGFPAADAEPALRYVRVPGRQRYRFLLWPNIVMRPLPTVTIDFVPSFKLPISRPRRFVDGVLAYRMDWFVRIDWRPRRDDGVAGRMKLFVKFDYYKNMGPPVIAEALPPDAAPEPIFHHRTGASKKHRFVALGVALDLGSP